MIRSGLGRLVRAVFWLSAGVLVATYAGIPAAILARGRLRPRPLRPVADQTGASVSVIIAAYDEEASIGPRLDNLVGPEAGARALEVVVASDGSTDRTNEIVTAYADRGVRLVALPRVGKAHALNAAVGASSGTILIFTDANTRFAPGAIDALLAPFSDPEVGGVAGDQRYVQASREDSIAQGERRYWDLDRMLKVAESRAGSVVSATGAIYAIRRELFQPVIAGVTDDFVTSVAVVAQGRRLVFAEDAVAYEPPAASGGDEFGRKVRIMTRGLRGAIVMRHLMDPRRHGAYAIQLAWHKVLRRLMVIPLLGLLATSLALVGRGPLYTLAAVGQVAGYGLGFAGLRLRGHPAGRNKLLALPAFFVLVNVAALKAIVDIGRGRRIERWEPIRSQPLVAPTDAGTARPDDGHRPGSVHGPIGVAG